MSAWGRLGLIQAAIADAESTKRLGERKSQDADKNTSLDAVAEVLGYETKKISSKEQPQGNEASSQLNQSTAEQPELPPSKSKVPPAQFVVVKSKTVYHQETEKPKELSGPTLKEWNNDKTEAQKEKDKNATLYFGLPSELMPSARYLPLLQNVLGKFNKTHKIDTKTVIRKTAAGKFLTQLPKQHLQQWPKNLLVVVDNSRALEPYWYDFELIINALTKILGDGVKAIAFDKDSIRNSHTPWCRYSNWPGRGEDFKFHYFFEHNPLAQADAILLLSDLGSLTPYANHKLSEFIANKIPTVQRKTQQFLTLSPVAVTTKAHYFLNPVSIIDTHALPRFTKQNKPNAINSTTEKSTTKEIETLLAAVSYLPVFDAALLRKIRTELTLGGSHLDGIIWNHEHISGNQVGKLLEPEHQDDYRTVFKSRFSQEQQENIWHVVEKHFANAVEGLNQLVGLQKFQSNTTTYSENSEAEKSAVKYFAALAASYENRDETSSSVLLKAQCKTAFETLSENIDDKTYQLLAAAAYKEEIQNGHWPEQLPIELKAKLSYLVSADENDDSVQYYVVAGTKQFSIHFINKFEIPDKNSRFQILETFNVESNLLVDVAIVDQRSLEVIKKYRSLLINVDQFHIPENCDLVITSGLEEICVSMMMRPEWSEKLAYMKYSSDLFELVSQPYHLPKYYAPRWREHFLTESKHTMDWGWQFKSPINLIGEDKFGSFIDLELFGIIQRFRWINPGTFLMGSPESEKGRFDRETQHQVTLTHGFWLADTTCTQALWQAVMGKNPSHFKGENKPVETISWLDAQEFIEKLAKKYPGIGFRLPTEAEWEYACRAGTDNPFSFGEELTLKQANYRGTWEYEGEPDKNALQQTGDVTDFSPNPWGLYQMHGNVWEWCEDAWHDNYKGAPTDGSAWVDKAPALRVVRGGSWSNGGRSLRSATRIGFQPDGRNLDVGLRISLGHELQGGGADSERSEPNSRGRR